MQNIYLGIAVNQMKPYNKRTKQKMDNLASQTKKWIFIIGALLLMLFLLTYSEKYIKKLGIFSKKTPVSKEKTIPTRLVGTVIRNNAKTKEITIRVSEQLGSPEKEFSFVTGKVVNTTQFFRQVKITPDNDIYDLVPSSFEEVTYGKKVSFVPERKSIEMDQESFDLLLITIEE